VEFAIWLVGLLVTVGTVCIPRQQLDTQPNKTQQVTDCAQDAAQRTDRAGRMLHWDRDSLQAERCCVACSVWLGETDS
jgi:hypothetical protein